MGREGLEGCLGVEGVEPMVLRGVFGVGGYGAGGIIVMGRVRAYMDGPRLLRMRLGELVPLVGVELRSWGWGLASLSSLHSLAWNCALGVGWLAPSPGVYGVGGGCAPIGSAR